MVADLTFWQEFGPFIIAMVAGLVSSGVLTLIGSRAAGIYEKTMMSRAAHFRGLSAKLRRTRRVSYDETIQQLRESAAGARKFQLIGIYGGTVFLSYHVARLIVGEGGVNGPGKWGIVLIVMAAATATVAYFERRSTRVRRARVEEEAALDKGEAATS